MSLAFEIMGKLVECLSFGVNIISLIIVVYATVQAIVLQCKNEPAYARKVLTKGINTGLTFNLAGEVMKIIVTKSVSELYLIGGILVLKVIIAVLLHYEDKWHLEKEIMKQKNEKINKKLK